MRKAQRNYVLARNYTEVGEYLKQLRLEAGLTQRDVSIALGYSSAQFISNFERGIAVPPLKKLKILQKLFRMNIGRLIELTLAAEKAIMIKVLESRKKSSLVMAPRGLSRKPFPQNETAPSALGQ